MLETIWIGAATALGILHLGVPAMMRSVYRFSARVKGIPLTLEQLPSAVAEEIAPRIPQLQALGFELVGCHDFGVLNLETRSLVAIFAHSQTQDMANVWVSVSPDNTSSYLEFSTHTSIGTVLETNSNRVLPLTPENPAIKVFRFPEISQAAELYAVHRRIVAKYAEGAWVRQESQGDAVERVTRVIENYGPRLLELGYFRLAEDGDFYHLTWKGAFLIALNGLWPTSLLRKWSARYAMRNELRSLRVQGITRLQKA